MNVTGTIQRTRDISPEEFHARYVARDVPVIVESAAAHWPAAQHWTSDGLRERIGSVHTRFKHSSSHCHPDFRRAELSEAFRTSEGTFSEFLDALVQPGAERVFLSGEEEFLMRRRVGSLEERNPRLAALLDDIELPQLFDEERLYTSWFWVSAAGVRTWLHYDNNGCHNLNAQVQGSKRVWLYDPDSLARTYPFPLGGRVPAYNCCRVDVESPENEEFPGFSDLPCQTGELFAGDLLFIPVDWLHTFLHVGPFNVNVNFWWKPRCRRQTAVSVRQAVLDAVAAMGGTQNLSADQLAAFAELERRLLSPSTGS